MAYLYKEGYQYSSINSYQSAISSAHDRIDGITVGQHPLITRLVKGVFHFRPLLPRYTRTWDVQTVLDFLRSLGDNGELSLKHLSWKVTMLLALSCPSKSADLALLDLSQRVYKPDGFISTHLPCQNSLDRVHRLYTSSSHLLQMICNCVLLQCSRPMKREPNFFGERRPSCW